jgi:hypothetical protein
MFQALKDFVVEYLIVILYALAGIAAISWLSGSASFTLKPLHRNYIKVHSNNLFLMNGEFESKPFRVFSKAGPTPSTSDLNNYQSLFEIINDGHEIHAIPENTIMSLTFIDKSRVAISLLSNNTEIFYQELAGKLKRNGFFQIDKKMHSSIGLPYILGGTYNYKSRIGVTKHGSLIVQTAEANQGALLFVFRKGYKRNRVYHFRRIQNDTRV